MHFERGTTGTHEGLTEVQGLIFMETALRPSLEVPMHTHENATIVLVLSGQYRECYRGTSSTCPSMTVISKPAGERHANETGPQGAACLVVELNETRISNLGMGAACRAPLVQKNGPAAHTGLRIVRELRRCDSYTRLALESAALQLVVDLSRQEWASYSSQPDWSRKVLEAIHNEPPGALSLSALATLVGVHPVHLARTFKKSEGCSIGEYARRLQVQRAISMITRSAAPLAEIAVAAGFCDQSHMGRAIKARTGLTAGQVRAEARS